MPEVRDVIVDAVRVPRKLFTNARGQTTHIDAAIVQVHCNDGTVGLGEADPVFPHPQNFLHEIVDAIRSILAPSLIGQDPRNIDTLRLRMDKVLTGHVLAKDAVEVALVDLCAKLYGVPAAMLLGGQQADVVPVIAPLGIGTPDRMAEEALGFVEKGFAGVKLKIGGNPAMDVVRIRVVREAVGESVVMRADANEAYDFPTALKFLRDIEPFSLQSVEQPLPGWDLDGMSRLSARVSTPLMADESLKDAASAMDIIRRGAAQLFHLKVQGRGGLLRARRIMAIAEAAGIPCVVGQISEMSLGVAADAVLAACSTTMLPGEMTGPLIIDGDVVTKKIDIRSGKICLSPECGLGLEIDPEALDRYRIPAQ